MMEKFNNEQTEPQTHTAGADMGKGELSAEVSLGKFKDVDALINAYNSLQSEFTKRCQKIKELESKLENGDKADSPAVTSKEKEESKTENQENTTLKDKDDVLKEYLLEVLSKKPKAIMMDGIGASVKTPVNKPRTIIEAGNLAKNLLSNH